MEGLAVAPSRGWLTPLRAALLVVGAVLCGVALSLILGSSPAHAADGDGTGPDLGPVGSVTNVATTAITSTIDQTIPAVQRTAHATQVSLATAVPAADPLVTPVVATVNTALTVVQQLAVPAVDSLLPFAQHLVATPIWTSAAVASVQLVPGAPSGHAAGALPAAQNGTGSVPLPDPILTSSSAAPAAALGVLLALFALVLLTARRRLADDALPASPTFETDTSPA
jgi:hypothetical protein